MKIHIVKKGDTLYFIGQKYNVSIEEIMSLNPSIKNPDVLDVGMKLKIPSTQGQHGQHGISGMEIMHQHVVKQGDTLWKLSKAWGVPLATMVYANPHLKNPNVLLTGEIVNIPKADTVVPQSLMPGKTNTGVKPSGGGAHPLHPTSIMQGVQGIVGKLSTAPVIGKKNTAPVQEKAPTAPVSPVPAPKPAPAPEAKDKETKVEPLDTGKVEPLAKKVEPLDTGKVEPLAQKVEPLNTGKVEPMDTGKVEPMASKVEPLSTGKTLPNESIAPLSTGKTLPNESIAPLSTGKTLPNESVAPLSTGKTLPNTTVAPLTTNLSPFSMNNVSPLSTNNMGAMSTNNMSPMSTNNMGAMSTNNMSPMSTNNMGAMSTNNMSPMSTNNMAPMSTNVSPLSMNNMAPLSTKKALPIEKAQETKVYPAQSEYMQYMDMNLFQQYNVPATEAMFTGNQSNMSPLSENMNMSPYGTMAPMSPYEYDCPPGTAMMGYPSMMPYGGNGWGYPGGGYAGISDSGMMSPMGNMPNYPGMVSPMSNMPNHAGMVSPLSGMPAQGLPNTMSTQSIPNYNDAGYPMSYPPYSPAPLWPQNTAVSPAPVAQTPSEDCGCGGKREEEAGLEQQAKSASGKITASKPRKKAKKAVIRTVAPRPKKKTTRGSRPWINR